MKWLYILYLVIKNRFYPTSVGSLRESMQRALDGQGTAYRVGEIIDKHGRDSWLEPLVDELGPYIQLQIGDIANILEVFHKLVMGKPRKATVLTIRIAFTIGSHLERLRLLWLSSLHVFSSLSWQMWHSACGLCGSSQEATSSYVGPLLAYIPSIDIWSRLSNGFYGIYPPMVSIRQYL